MMMGRIHQYCRCSRLLAGAGRPLTEDEVWAHEDDGTPECLPDNKDTNVPLHLDPNKSYTIRNSEGVILHTRVFGTEAEEILTREKTYSEEHGMEDFGLEAHEEWRPSPLDIGPARMAAEPRLQTLAEAVADVVTELGGDSEEALSAGSRLLIALKHDGVAGGVDARTFNEAVAEAFEG